MHTYQTISSFQERLCHCASPIIFPGVLTSWIQLLLKYLTCPFAKSFLHYIKISSWMFNDTAPLSNQHITRFSIFKLFCRSRRICFKALRLQLVTNYNSSTLANVQKHTFGAYLVEPINKIKFLHYGPVLYEEAQCLQHISFRWDDSHCLNQNMDFFILLCLDLCLSFLSSHYNLYLKTQREQFSEDNSSPKLKVSSFSKADKNSS